MAHPVVGHQNRQIVHSVVGTAGQHQGAHHVGDRPVKEVRAVLVEPAHHVTLSHDADHSIGIDDHHGPDVVLRKVGEQCGDRRRSGDGCHRRSLAAQNVSDTHGHLL